MTRNLARFLHDDIIQCLMSIVYQMYNLDLEESQIEMVSKTVIGVAKQLREIIQAVSPRLKIQTLASALEHNLEITSPQISPEIDSLSLEQRQSIYYVVFGMTQTHGSDLVLTVDRNDENVKIQAIKDGLVMTTEIKTTPI